MKSIRPVQLELGQPATSQRRVSGSSVSVLNGVLPFLVLGSVPKIVCFPVAEIFGALWPGTALPPVLVQVITAVPLAFSTKVTSVLPSPVANPSAMSEPSENEAENLIPGPAETGKVNRLATSKTLNIERILFFIYFLIGS